MPLYWPTDIKPANLKHWIEPALANADTDQMLPNSTEVSQLRDMLAITDYAQGTASLRPLYKTNQRFGRGCLEFDGTDDLLVAGDTNLVVGASAGTMICAFAPDDHTTTQSIWGELALKFGLRVASGSIVGRVVVAGPTPHTASRGLSGAAGLWHVAAVRYNSAVGLECTLDDPDNTATNGAATGNFDALGALQISDAAAGDEYDGRFGAGAIWDVRLSGDDFYKAFFYFLARWGNRRDALEIARERASRFLQLRSRPRTFVEMRTDLRSLDVALGGDVGVSHPRGPHPLAAGWTRADRRPTRKLYSKLDPADLSVSIKLADSLDVAQMFHDSGGARRASDAKREGVVIAGAASSYEFYRIGESYVRDPGDLRVVKVPPGIIRVERTPIHWAADPARLVSGIVTEHFATNHLTSSSFINGLTGLTQTPGTGGTIALDTAAPFLFDVSITPQSGELTSGTTDCWLGWPATISFSANQHLCFSTDYRCDSGHAMSYQLVRNVDGFFWNDGTQAWQSGSVWNAMTISAALDILRGRSKDINVGGSATTVTARVGLPGTTSGRNGHVYHCQLESPGGFPTSRIPTTTLELARADELIMRPNPSGRRSWPNTEGTLLLEYTPLYSRQDLVDAGGSAVFLPHLVHVHHSVITATTGHGWFLSYSADSGANGQFQFFGSNAGSGPGPPRAVFNVATVAGQTYRIGARWLAGVVSLYVDGVEGTGNTNNGTPTETDDSVLYVGGRNACDGYLENIEVKPRAMHPEWIKAWAA